MGFRIVFMGTPDFAVHSLDKLHQSEHEVVGVITATDKYGGRGKKQLLESAVKKYAVANHIPVLQPKNLKASSFLDELKKFKADFQVVVAFRMLPEVVWSMPTHGTMNLHGSLLPKYRGAAPINWAVINGEKETGVTTFLLKHAIDTGDLLHQVVVPIDYLDTAGSIHDKLMHVGADLVLRSTNEIYEGKAVLTPQNAQGVTHAPKIFTEDCQINCNKNSRTVYNFIRGLDPYPGAWLDLGDQSLKVFNPKEVIHHSQIEPGNIVVYKGNVAITTSDGLIVPDLLQISGSRRMSNQEFLNGYAEKLKLKHV